MDFALPEIGEGVYDAEFVRWLVKPGDMVSHGQSLMEVMTDKATMEIPSPFDGKLTKLLAESGQKIKVGEVVLSFDGEMLSKQPGMTAKPTLQAAEQVRNGPPAGTAPMAVKAAPSVRHLARKLGVDLAQIRGSGPGGRIVVDDLSAAVKQASPAKPPTAPPLAVGVAGTRVKMVGLRRRIAEHMVEAKNAIPHYTYIDEVDISDLVKLRSLTADHFAQSGVKLTYLAFFVKAAVLALKEVPIVNSSLDEKANEIVLHDHYEIGIAVATPGGLMVPVIRDANRKQIAELAREIERLSSDARAGKARRNDLGGSTFTITSIGGIGGLISTPIINYPEAAILGIGKVVKRPVFDEAGQVVPADTIYLSISFDHRIVDGAIGALFGNALVKHLKQPAALLLS
jgi:pyruvate dehydrogenase E2 component (dihydrolipoamide acetyltransferase)/2-oxoisovalerate dehydrogenase E2 component (dihydrolipoyl transacylase)